MTFARDSLAQEISHEISLLDCVQRHSARNSTGLSAGQEWLQAGFGLFALARGPHAAFRLPVTTGSDILGYCDRVGDSKPRGAPQHLPPNQASAGCLHL